jgi:hypothetical protein
MTDDRVYLVVDFETVSRHGDWLCFAAMVVSYPGGNIIEAITIGCERTDDEYDASTLAFWTRNQIAKDFIAKNIKMETKEDAESKVISFINGTLQKFPAAFVISDNPEFDICILNRILRSHGHDPISDRKHGQNKYYHSICTWSYQLAVCSWLGVTAHQLETGHAATANHRRRIDDYFGPRHTPLADCARIIASHFHLIDIMVGGK